VPTLNKWQIVAAWRLFRPGPNNKGYVGDLLKAAHPYIAVRLMVASYLDWKVAIQ
jgi:hypothetical protein